MDSPQLLRAVFLIHFSVFAFVPLHASPEAGAFQTAEGLITELYRSVTFEAGTTPDWDKVKSMFIDEAVIVLRTSREETTVFSVEGFVDDFIRFSQRDDVQQSGFVERIVKMKPMVFGDIAHVLVLYEASIPDSPRPPRQGVDSFELIKKQDRWWIVSVTNELPSEDRPAPAELRD